ncbi:Magnesium-protoporphyrin O-methyltransferase [Rhodovastum atsumiense]|uniref:Magnesium protoporphyrin IX methyltransferase n=1 Tax=Rhodovastum atsumiense TaxID=504468 RepID=A0A5M6IX45_9PROT|nr:magnesium protoporphyrin IX methyltransferase [Rhodovastum atsumiense]KAA5612904.1 magnesium protoporphyrin IX methyltransferase [Rhodovastum atsumiense]CAH2601014.1 Magnesium-protoporphyrin O-methyltransferase [Rhodovastum atsumiense]
MPSTTYQERRGQLTTYFDRTASEAWKRLTSDAPVSGIRATVRAGREEMRATLLDWLPADLHGRRLLDAGCGTGALAVEAARRGAHVVAIDVAASLVDMARERAEGQTGDGTVEFKVGDMLDPALGSFDHVVAMDSLIHYHAPDIVNVLATLADRTRHSVVFTFAPRTILLAAMHAAGKFFPRSDRAPAIEPVAEKTLLRLIDGNPALSAWQAGRTRRIVRGFYTSQALELVPR